MAMELFNERNFRETQPKLFISKGVLSPSRSNTGDIKGQNSPNFDMQKWVNNLLVVNGLLNADPCCADFVSNFTAGESVFTTNVPLVQDHTAVAVNATATIETSQLITGYITSTSAAATAITLPSATAIATAIGATAGTVFDFIVDNSAGANTVTITPGGGTAAGTSPITGGATLTVSVANVVGIFRLVFTSATAATIRRLI
jgi:hypothetical protein